MNGKVNFYLKDYSNSKFSNNFFDKIFTLETLVHSPDIVKTLKEFYRILKPGGKLVLFEYSISPFDEFNHWERKMLNIINKGSAMLSLGKMFHDKIPQFIKQVEFNIISDEDITEHMIPSAKRFYYFALTVVSLILSRGLIAETIRFFYYRPRPFEALNFIPLINQDTVAAFPSGHAAFYFALTFAIFYVSRRWFYWFLAGAVLMGLARAFIGVHWPLDILAGALIGLFSIFMVKYTLARTLKIKVSD